MKNHVQPGKRITWTNGTGVAVSSGDPVKVGDRLGVACVDIGIGATGELAIKEVFALAKSTAEAISQGAQLYWDAGNSVVTANVGAGIECGYAHAAAAETAATVNVDLNA